MDVMAVRSEFPDTWLREQRGGYGYTERVPCRVLTQTARRIKIRALRKDGTTAVRYVTPERIERH
jgi:hypothetical protein